MLDDSTLPDALTQLATGPLYRFSDWPNDAVPKFGAGAYTIWRPANSFPRRCRALSRLRSGSATP
jgi:hypothetical protein